jgi:hypothetical protein
MCIAYLEKGKASEWVGRNDFVGKTFSVSQVVFKGKGESNTEKDISLEDNSRSPLDRVKQEESK